VLKILLLADEKSKFGRRDAQEKKIISSKTIKGA